MAISVQDLPPNWAGLGQQGRIDWFKEHNVSVQDLLDAGWIDPSESNWFLDQGLREGAPPASSPASSPADSTTETDATQRIENLANELGIPKFVVANLVNNGISDASIREKYRSTGTGTETGTETGTGTGPSAGPSTGTGTGPSTGSSTGTKTDSLAGTKITGSGGTKQLTLPEGWDNYNANQKISWFKNNNVLVSDLQAAGVSAADINWMLQNGYTETETGPSTGPSTETDATQRIENLANELGIPKFVVANLVNNGISDASIREKYRSTGTGTGTGTGPSTGTSTVKGGTGTGTGSLAGTKITGSGGTKQLTLPEGWDNYTEDAKLKWFRDNNVLVSDLQAAGVSATDILYMLQKGYQGLADLTKGSGFDTSEGYGGVKVEGESGLREGYAPYVQDYLERMSGLLARRNVDPITGKPVYTGPQFGDTGVGGYGADTLTNLKALQTQRENMMGMGTGAGATPMYTPSKFSFASPNASLTAQGIKSLAKGSEQDKINFYKNYMQGADQTLRNAANTYIGPQKQEDWDYLQTKGLAGFSQGGGVTALMDDSYADGGFTGQYVPSTFTPPTGSYQQSTYTPGSMNYTAPGTYQAGTIGSTFDQNKAGAYATPKDNTIASTFTTPANIYSAGNIGTDFSGIKSIGYATPKDNAITSTFTTPANIYSAGNIGSTFDATKAGIYKTPTGTEEIKSTFTTPANIYSAGNIGSTYDPVTKSYTGPGTGISTDTFDAAAMQRLMNPYTSGVVNPQLEEARRQAEITRQAQAARMAKAGAFGGSRQAIMESELNRNLGTQLGTIYGTGQKEAYDAALRAFEAEQGRKLQASTATEAARQEAGRQGLSEAQTRAQLALQGQTAQEAARQAAGAQALSAAQTAGQLGLQAQTAQEAARQAAGQQALSAAQTAAELGLRGQTAQEAARQAAGQQALTAATTEAELAQRGQIAQEQARQAAGQQALTAAQTAAQLGLQGSQLSEQSRQFAANYGLQSAQTAAQYDQAARQLQQQAEEAQARGDQFAADLALRQLQEAQRAAEATRGFEYQQARDTYLDPFRELSYAQQLLGGLPIKAGDVGDSPTLQALIGAIGLGGILNPSAKL